MKFLRRPLLYIPFLLFGMCILGQELVVRDGDELLHISAPKFHFLTGKPLERIKNGNVVAYDFQLSVLGEAKSRVLGRNFERFVFSYDLWEERFSVSRMRSTQGSAAHLTAGAAEAWCLDHMAFSSSGIPGDMPVWVRLEVRAQEPKEQASIPGEEGLSIASLIDIFGRASKTKQPQYWKLEAGPLKLSAVRAVGRGAD